MKKVTAVDKDGNIHEIEVSALSFRPSVYAIVIHEGCILLSPQFDGYDLPGGGIELGEDHLKAVVRETKEETGLDVAPRKLAGVDTSFFVSHDKSTPPMHSILMYYFCEFIGGSITDTGLEKDELDYVKKAVWLDVGELQDIHVLSSNDWRKYVE